MDVGKGSVCLEIAVRVLAAATLADAVWCNLERARLYTTAVIPRCCSSQEEGASSHLGFLDHRGFLHAFPLLAITIGKCSTPACDLNFEVAV